jgi:hypothetical protein
VILSLVGLLITGIFQLLSLYVWPLQIIVSSIISLTRRELKEFWSGKTERNYLKFVFIQFENFFIFKANIVCPRQQRVRNLCRIKSKENFVENYQMITNNENQAFAENKTE